MEGNHGDMDEAMRDIVKVPTDGTDGTPVDSEDGFRVDNGTACKCDVGYRGYSAIRPYIKIAGI